MKSLATAAEDFMLTNKILSIDIMVLLTNEPMAMAWTVEPDKSNWKLSDTVENEQRVCI